MPSDKKELFLTFDDGPIHGPTEFVLDTLKRFSAKATFFCIGDNVQKYPHIFRKVVMDGHAIGNHTFHHLNGWKTTLDQYVQDVDDCQKLIQTHLGDHSQPAIFRPPYGRIMRQQIQALKHFQIIMWDVLSVDYDKNLSPEKCLHNTIKATRDGSFIVFHDSLKAERNMTFALPRLLEHFASRGFSFKAIV